MEAPIEVLADRDVKGRYRKAMAGERSNFTCVNHPYEAPLDSDGRETSQKSAAKVLAKLEKLGWL